MNKKMTEGSVAKSIVVFALPLMFGNFFQQLYNTADSLIVGKVLGSNSLAAVASAGNLIFLLIGFFQGLSAGAGVVIARYVGAGDEKHVKISIHTTVALGLVSGVFLTVVGILFTPAMLRMMNTPDEVIADSISYFRFYFSGALGVVMYNTFVGILQATGDSKHPLYFLIISSIVNVLLDLLFIVVLGKGAGAAGLATAISTVFSAILCMIELMRRKGAEKLILSQIKFDLPAFKKILSNGIPSGMQNSIIGFSNVVVQSGINSVGAEMMSGYGAYTKIEGFAFLPITSFAIAITTFISQNLGAKKGERAHKGAVFGAVVCCALAEIIGVIVFVFARQLVGLFDSNPQVIEYGVAKAHATVLFYCLLAYSHAMAAVMRGVGRPAVSMVVMLVCWCFLRVTILETVLQVFQWIPIIYMIHPLTWSFSTIAFTFFFFRVKWGEGRKEPA